MIRGDSVEYDLLEKWAKDFDCEGHYSCEIGVREGIRVLNSVILCFMIAQKFEILIAT